MRAFGISTVLFSLFVLAAPADAGDGNFAQGFGGLRLDNTFSTESTFGGAVAGHLTPNIQLIGEAGRISNVLPSTFDSLLGLSPVGFGVSAFYGTGGVRFTSANASGVRPYAETAAGFARLRTSVSGLEGMSDTIADLIYPFLDRTEPTASVGGGVTFERGSFVADVGYRYRRIFSSGWMDALAFGDSLHTNEVRFGVGVKF
ncbi:MAG TPA: hypothetical protein VJP86_17855 [Vicinamibacterales bacterium]|jgi:opacity protein-like surface antigen|nr:hypothetical protein [Vicinamibacterales bacterium]